MEIERLFRRALWTSMTIHLTVFLPFIHLGLPQAPRMIRTPEFTYQANLPNRLPDLSNKIAVLGKAASMREQSSLQDTVPSNHPRVVQTPVPKSRERLHHFKKIEPKVSLSRLQPLESESRKDLGAQGSAHEAALGYFKLIRERIRREAFRLYQNTRLEGEVIANFKIERTGDLQGVDLASPEDTQSVLIDMARKSLEFAAPYPAFPTEIRDPELRFRIHISFRASGPELQ